MMGKNTSSQSAGLQVGDVVVEAEQGKCALAECRERRQNLQLE